MIRDVVAADAEGICRIYNHYIRETCITFEEQPVAPQEMVARIGEVANASLPWLVVEQDGEILGYACATKWKIRSAYRFSVETTVYLAPGSHSKGIGTRLYGELLARLKDRKLHLAIGGIALPNAASIALHEKLGFRKVAQFIEVGFKFGRWVDVGYWQIAL